MQQNFANHFLGVSLDDSASGDTYDIEVDMSPLAVYRYAIASTTLHFGQKLAVASSGTGSSTVLVDQQVEKAGATADAIAIAVEEVGTAKETVDLLYATAYAPNNVNAVVG